jgi:peptidoglycan/LPS O-acetylase OafA/YrhL
MAELTANQAANTRLRSVDSLRGAAALAVVFHHAVNAGAAPPEGTGWFPPLVALAELGRLGVPLFFVISGFCIHARWVQQKLKGHTEAPAFGHFWRRRLGRLYPPYFVALVGSMGLVLLAYSTHRHWPILDLYPSPQLPWIGLDFLAHTTLLHGFIPQLDRAGGNAPFWTLAREEYFYLLYFPLLAFRKRLGPGTMIASVSVLGAALSAVVAHFVSVDTPLGLLLQSSALTLWSQWCLGAVAVEGALGAVTLPRWCREPILVLFWGVAAWGSQRWFEPLAPLLWGLVFFTLLNALVHREIEGRWPRHAWLQWLERVGLFSYSLYLVHHPVRGLVKHVLERAFTGRSLPVYLVGLSAVVAAGCVTGWLFFLLVERRFLHQPAVRRS